MNNESLAKEFFLVGKLFTYPTLEMKEELEKVVTEDSFHNILSKVDSKNIENLQGEYTRLFVSGYPSTPCPPYFSAFKTGLVVSDHTDALYDIYDKYGIEIPEGQFPDFIPILMEFMVLLLSNNQDEESKTFYNKYISWLSEYSQNVKRNSKMDYFNLTSEKLDSLVKISKEYFNK